MPQSHLHVTLQTLREDIGLTQAEAAAACGWPAHRLALIEEGSFNPDIISLRQLARAYGCAAEDFDGARRLPPNGYIPLTRPLLAGGREPVLANPPGGTVTAHFNHGNLIFWPLTWRGVAAVRRLLGEVALGLCASIVFDTLQQTRVVLAPTNLAWVEVGDAKPAALVPFEAARTARGLHHAGYSGRRSDGTVDPDWNDHVYAHRRVALWTHDEICASGVAEDHPILLTALESGQPLPLVIIDMQTRGRTSTTAIP